MQDVVDQAIMAPEPTIVFFYTDSCPECVAMIEDLNQFIDMEEDRYGVVCVEGAEHPEMVKRYAVDTYPTSIAFVHGAERGRRQGRLSLGEMSEFVRNARQPM